MNIQLDLTSFEIFFPFVCKVLNHFLIFQMIEISMHVHHEGLNLSKLSQIPQRWDYQVCSLGNTMNTHKKWSTWIYDMLVTHVPPPIKTFTPFTPKHNRFLDNSSLVSSPPLNNTTIITSMRLLESNLFTILSTHTKINTLVQQSTIYAWTNI